MPEGGELIVSTSERVLNEDECERLARVIEPGPFIVIQVGDTGSGMAPHVQQRVFEPFFTNKSLGKGTGIGLAMVYGTVRSHAGAIELESAVGSGTVFTIYLPLRLHPSEESRAAAPSVLTGTGRILVADDDDAVRDVARRMLTQMGYEVECVSDGADALERVTADPGRFDLIVLDGNMPRLQGRDAAVLIRRLAPQIRLVLSTGYLEPGDSDRLAEYGFDAEIAKPYSMSELSRLVAQLLAAAKNTAPASEIAAGAG